MAKYLVTGGCGFIGRHLVKRLLSASNDVTVIDDLSTGDRTAIPDNVPLIIANAADGEAVRDAVDGMDGVFHLAGDPSVPRCMENYLASHLTNQTTTVAILDAAARIHQAGGRMPIVFASSCAIYGRSELVPLVETTPAAPVSSYGLDKITGEYHAALVSELFDVNSVALRYFNVYGPGQDPRSPYTGVLSIFSSRLMKNEGIIVHGDGTQVRDFIYVEDVVTRTVQAMALAAKGESAVLNVCTGIQTRVIDAANTIAEICGVTPRIAFEPPRAGDVTISLGAPEASTKTLGALPPTPLATGLEETLKWMRSVG